MTHNTRGIGLFAAIVIVAILGVGTVTAVQVYQNTKTLKNAEVDTELPTNTIPNARVAAAQKNAVRTLTDIHADLENAAGANIETTLQKISKIRAELANAYASADAKLRSEFNALSSQFNQLEVEIESESSNATDTATEIMNTLQGNTAAKDSTANETSSETMVDVPADSATKTSRDTNTNTSTSVETNTQAEIGTNANPNGNTSIETSGAIEIN